MTTIEDLEKELGVSPSGIYSDVRARLDILESRINNPFTPSPNVNNPFVIGNSAVTIRTGSGIPTQADVNGSLYLRIDGASSIGLYVRRNNTWQLILTNGDGTGNPVSVKLFGALGNGVADDTSAIQTAITTVNSLGGGIVRFDTGTYKCTSQITISDKVHLLGDGPETTTLNFSGALTGSFPDAACIFATGSLTEIQSIASPVSANDQSITLSSSPNVSPEDIIIIYNSTDGSFSAARPQYRAGEFARVLSVVGSTVNLFDKIYGSYTPGANIHVFKLNPINTSIKGLTIIGQGSGQLSIIKLDMTSDIDISYVHARNTNFANINISRSYNILLDHIKIEDVSASVSLNYGIVIANSQKAVISNSLLFTTRHGLAHGGGDFSGAVPVRDVVISNCIVGNNGVGDVCGLEWHGNAENIMVDNCFLPHGMEFGGDRSRITNCTIYTGISNGEAIHASELLGLDLIIEGNEIHATGAINSSYGLVNIGYPGQQFLSRTKGTARVANNKIRMHAFAGVGIYLLNSDFLTNDVDVEIHSNHISCEDAVNTSYIGILASDGFGFRNISACNNTLRGVGLFVGGGNAESVNLSGNTVIESTYYGIANISNGIPIRTKQLVVSHNNVIEKAKFSGIRLDGDSQSFSILDVKNNFAINCAQVTSGSSFVDSSILVNKAQLAILRTNTIGDNQGTHTQNAVWSALNVTNLFEGDNVNIGNLTNVNVSGINNRVSDTVNVKWFGAVGDGVTDDTLAIRAAFASVSAGGTVIFPQTSVAYLISGSITITSAMTKILIKGFGRGTIIRAANAGFYMFIVQADYVRFDGIAFEGATTIEAPHAPLTGGSYGIFTSVTNPAQYGEIKNCFFTGPNSTTGLHNGVKLDTGCQYWEIAYNKFERLIGNNSSTGAGYGILLGASNFNNIHHNRFIGNTASSPVQGRHAIYISAGSSQNQVHNNIIDSFNESSIPIFSSIVQPVCDNNVVESNQILNQALGDSGTAGIEITEFVKNTIVRDNRIVNCGRTSILINLSSGLSGDCADNQIINNRIISAGQTGISVSGAARTIIQGNQIIDASTSSSGVYSAISLTQSNSVAADMTHIINNVVGSATPSTPVHRSGVSLDSTSPVPTNTIITGNVILPGTVNDIALNSIAIGTQSSTNVAGNFVAGTNLTETTIIPISGLAKFQANSTGLGFFGATPVAKQTVTGTFVTGSAASSALTALTNYGAITNSATSDAVSYTNAGTTPSATGIRYAHVTNASPTTITNFTGGVNGQVLFLTFQDGNTTIDRSNSVLSGSANFTSAQYKTLTLAFNSSDGLWYEMARSTNG